MVTAAACAENEHFNPVNQRLTLEIDGGGHPVSGCLGISSKTVLLTICRILTTATKFTRIKDA